MDNKVCFCRSIPTQTNGDVTAYLSLLRFHLQTEEQVRFRPGPSTDPPVLLLAGRVWTWCMELLVYQHKREGQKVFYSEEQLNSAEFKLFLTQEYEDNK